MASLHEILGVGLNIHDILCAGTFSRTRLLPSLILPFLIHEYFPHHHRMS